MNREELAHRVVEEGLSELGIAVSFVWFRARFEEAPTTEDSELFGFFEEYSISRPNRTRLRNRLTDDRRVLPTKNSYKLKLSAMKEMDQKFLPEPHGLAEHLQPLTGLAGQLIVHANNIPALQTRLFVLEAISCLQNSSYRAAVLMSWCGALSILQEHVFANQLAEFNSDGLAQGLLKKPIRSMADMRGAMKEGHFLEAIGRISLIDDSIKRSLKRCLDRRNECSHPSDIRIGEAAVADHLETLMLNVFDRFAHA
jgi:hypothetical protein